MPQIEALTQLKQRYPALDLATAQRWLTRADPAVTALGEAVLALGTYWHLWRSVPLDAAPALATSVAVSRTQLAAADLLGLDAARSPRQAQPHRVETRQAQTHQNESLTLQRLALLAQLDATAALKAVAKVTPVPPAAKQAAFARTVLRVTGHPVTITTKRDAHGRATVQLSFRGRPVVTAPTLAAAQRTFRARYFSAGQAGYRPPVPRLRATQAQAEWATAHGLPAAAGARVASATLPAAYAAHLEQLGQLILAVQAARLTVLADTPVTPAQVAARLVTLCAPLPVTDVAPATLPARLAVVALGVDGAACPPVVASLAVALGPAQTPDAPGTPGAPGAGVTVGTQPSAADAPTASTDGPEGTRYLADLKAAFATVQRTGKRKTAILPLALNQASIIRGVRHFDRLRAVTVVSGTVTAAGLRELAQTIDQALVRDHADVTIIAGNLRGLGHPGATLDAGTAQALQALAAAGATVTTTGDYRLHGNLIALQFTRTTLAIMGSSNVMQAAYHRTLELDQLMLFPNAHSPLAQWQAALTAQLVPVTAAALTPYAQAVSPAGSTGKNHPVDPQQAVAAFKRQVAALDDDSTRARLTEWLHYRPDAVVGAVLVAGVEYFALAFDTAHLVVLDTFWPGHSFYAFYDHSLAQVLATVRPLRTAGAVFAASGMRKRGYHTQAPIRTRIQQVFKRQL